MTPSNLITDVAGVLVGNADDARLASGTTAIIFEEPAVPAAAAAARTFALGTAGAGFGATTVNLKGGLGSASAVTRDGHTVGALVAVNACGSVNVGSGPQFWAAPFEREAEFGGLGFPLTVPPAALTVNAK